jgi:hypothetical protein
MVAQRDEKDRAGQRKNDAATLRRFSLIRS